MEIERKRSSSEIKDCYQIELRGVHISFPYEPYKVQVDYMEKVIECLQRGVNGLLESPTGTGKTLSLLCSALSWQESKKAQQQLFVMQNSAGGGSTAGLNELQSFVNSAAGLPSSGSHLMVPQIIYSSRTHTQISQAVQELKRSRYKHVKAVVLGSREQLCLHPEVKKIREHSAQVYLCRAKINQKSCPFYLSYEEKILSNRSYQEATVMDIEDLLSEGKKNVVCPYFASRSLKHKADIVFAPYNYIIDLKTRRTQGIELGNCVVIFDEAHNIESVCEESMSFQLRAHDISMCINEVSVLMNFIKGADDNGLSGSESGSPNFTLHDLTILKVMLCELDDHLAKAAAETPNGGASKPGDYMIDLLQKVEITSQRRDIMLDLLDKIILYQSTAAIERFPAKAAGLQKFQDLIRVLFSRFSEGVNTVDAKKELAVKYRVYLQYETPNKSQTEFWSTEKKWKLDCWCFSPGIGMQDVMNQGTHSILLTSGTLSPLPPLIYELGVDFPVCLENPHIISDKQFFVGVVTHGPDGTQLNSSFQNRSSEKYISSLGRAVSNFCRIIPDGVLVFFPSYSVLKGNVGRWEETGLWQSLSGIKSLFMEPQNKDAFQESIEQFYTKINEPGSKGATLLAVCRGKVSEGLDFTDKNARAVIVTGLPFPPAMDPRVKLKREYLDVCSKEKKVLTGTEWYILQASRAVNQAIGRVIRHKNDYGAILLCDNRFAEKRIQCQLSKWVRGHVQVFSSFGPALKHLSSFFKGLENSPCEQMSTKGSFSKGSHSVSGFCLPSSQVSCEKTPVTKSQSSAAIKTPEVNIFDGYRVSGSTSRRPDEKRPESVFDALDKCEGCDGVSSSEKALSDQNEIMQASTSVSGRENKRRKLNIEFRVAVQEDSAASAKNEKRETCKKFLVEVKGVLSSSDLYRQFCTAMSDYRSVKDTKVFADRMCHIFNGIPDRQKYLLKLSELVKPQERQTFLSLSVQKPSLT